MSIQPNIVPFTGFVPNVPDRTVDFTEDSSVATVAIHRANKIFKFDFSRCEFSGYTDERNTNLHVSLKVEGKVFQDIWIEGTWGGTLVIDMPDKTCITDPFRVMIDTWLAVNDLPPGYPTSTHIKIDGEEIDFNITPC